MWTTLEKLILVVTEANRNNPPIIPELNTVKSQGASFLWSLVLFFKWPWGSNSRSWKTAPGTLQWSLISSSRVHWNTSDYAIQASLEFPMEPRLPQPCGPFISACALTYRRNVLMVFTLHFSLGLLSWSCYTYAFFILIYNSLFIFHFIL